MDNIFVRNTIVAMCLFLGCNVYAADRSTIARYYQNVSGLKKEELKTALAALLFDHKEIEYGSDNQNTGKECTWWAFYVTDRKSDNSVINRYSPATFYFGRRGIAASGMNIEHSMPKSWWTGTDGVMAHRDLFNLYPSPKEDNSAKANYPMAYVTTVTSDSGDGYDKVGKGTVDGTTQMCWEPGDEWKGDFARSYMYMSVCYQSYTWRSRGTTTLTTEDWPTLKQWARDLYMQWSKDDRISDIETSRNDMIYSIQQNRNPFVDFPNIAEYIWGDSVGVAFYPSRAITTASDDDRYTVKSTGIRTAKRDKYDARQPYVEYRIDGRKVKKNNRKGVYIRKYGKKTKKYYRR